jgi:hypothetical protein
VIKIWGWPTVQFYSTRIILTKRTEGRTSETLLLPVSNVSKQRKSVDDVKNMCPRANQRNGKNDTKKEYEEEPKFPAILLRFQAT